jgi:hypothetical protein
VIERLGEDLWLGVEFEGWHGWIVRGAGLDFVYNGVWELERWSCIGTICILVLTWFIKHICFFAASAVKIGI